MCMNPFGGKIWRALTLLLYYIFSGNILEKM